jgi:putative hydrolase of HD superfamily
MDAPAERAVDFQSAGAWFETAPWVALLVRRFAHSRHFPASAISAIAVLAAHITMEHWKELGESIPQRLRQQLDFILEIDRLKSVLRRSYLVGADRKENSAEHSWHLAVAAMVLSEHAKDKIDLGRVIRLVMVHDLVEIDAGDTFIYDDTANLDKAAREQAAANRIFGLLPEEQATKFMGFWREFEDRKSPEAKFAFALDRLMPILHNVFTGGRSWKEHGIRQAQALAKNRPIEDGAPALWQAVESLIKQTLAE